MLEFDQVGRRFGARRVLDGVSLTVERRQLLGLLGRNGAGKTTLLRMGAGLLPPSQGRVRVGGVDVIREGPRIRQRVGYLPENCPLYGEMRVKEFLRFRAGLKGLGSGRARHRVDEVTDSCGLREIRRQPIRRLSLGFRQRVALAEALLAEPELLILDEPTRGLDPLQAGQAWDLLRDLAGDRAVVVATHDLETAARHCTHLAVLGDGAVTVQGRTAQVLDPLPHGSVVHAELRGPERGIEEGLAGMALVSEIELTRRGGWTLARIHGVATADLRLPVARLAMDRGWDMRELHLERRDLQRLLETPSGGAGP